MLVTHWYLTFCNPMDCSPPGSSVHEILQARILERIAISFSEHHQYHQTIILTNVHVFIFLFWTPWKMMKSIPIACSLIENKIRIIFLLGVVYWNYTHYFSSPFVIAFINEIRFLIDPFRNKMQSYWSFLDIEIFKFFLKIC